MVYSKEPVTEDFHTRGVLFHPVCKETVTGVSLVVPLTVNTEDILNPLSMLGRKINNLFSNIAQTDATRPELISTLTSTITHFKEYCSKLTDSLKNYVDFTFQHRCHRRGVGAIIAALGSLVNFVSNVVTRYRIFRTLERLSV